MRLQTGFATPEAEDSGNVRALIALDTWDSRSDDRRLKVAAELLAKHGLHISIVLKDGRFVFGPSHLNLANHLQPTARVSSCDTSKNERAAAEARR